MPTENGKQLQQYFDERTKLENEKYGLWEEERKLANKFDNLSRNLMEVRRRETSTVEEEISKNAEIRAIQKQIQKIAEEEIKLKEEIKKKEKEKNKKKEPPKPKLNKNDIKSRVLKSYNELYNKYKDAFKFSETTTLNDEEQAKKIFVEIRDSIISKGDYSNHEKENLILKFFEQNPLNKIQLKLIFELREQIKKIQEERYEEKKRMYQKMKERERNLDRYANTKLSVEVDLVFSALFGSNFS